MSANPVLSIVVPMYNEAEGIRPFYDRTARVLSELGVSWEIIAVNDGSTDDTLEGLSKLNAEDPRVKVIDLSRNFGKEIALSAGIDFATGDAIIPMDADLQDPPEVIPEFVAKWREGYDVVYGTRSDRAEDSWLKRMTAGLFYKVIRRLVRVDIPPDAGDFRLIARPVVDAITSLREQHRFMKGLFSWVGFRQTRVVYKRDVRFSGTNKWNYWKLWNLAIEGVTSFSYVPLQIAMYFGMLIAFLALAFGLYLVITALLYGNPVPGYPSLMVIILALGGVQLITLGIMGEYIGRIYTESKRRPLYFVRQKIGISPDSDPCRTNPEWKRDGKPLVSADGRA